MEYISISPPLTFNDPHKASKKEAKEFFNWFLSVKDERLKILEKAIQTTSGFEMWKANFIPGSLQLLQDWLKKIAELRPMTQEEIDKEEAKIKEPFKGILHPGTTTYTGKTISIAFDSGVYMGEVLRKNNPGLEWKLHLHKTYDQNQPVLGGFPNVDFNPRVIMENVISKLTGDKPVDLVKLYEVWKSYLGKK